MKTGLCRLKNTNNSNIFYISTNWKWAWLLLPDGTRERNQLLKCDFKWIWNMGVCSFSFLMGATVLRFWKSLSSVSSLSSLAARVMIYFLFKVPPQCSAFTYWPRLLLHKLGKKHKNDYSETFFTNVVVMQMRQTIKATHINVLLSQRLPSTSILEQHLKLYTQKKPHWGTLTLWIKIILPQQKYPTFPYSSIGNTDRTAAFFILNNCLWPCLYIPTTLWNSTQNCQHWILITLLIGV